MTHVFCKYVLVYEAASKCILATADTYVNSQNLSSYTKYLSYVCIFASIFMYTKRFKV